MDSVTSTTLHAQLEPPLWEQAAAVTPRMPQSRWRATMDVIGGVTFVFLVSVLMIRATMGLFVGQGFAPQIGWESVWILVCIVAAPMVPSGIRHVITWRTTWEGFILDWPELSFAAYTFVQALQYGTPAGFIGPLALALSVGTAEEMLFRVLLLGWLVTRVRTEWALLISAVVFGCAHLQALSVLGLLSVMPQFSGGMILGAMYLRSRNPLGGILAHAAWDFPIFLAYGAGIAGGSTEAGVPSVLSLMPWIILSIYGLYLVREGVDVAGREPLPQGVPRPAV